MSNNEYNLPLEDNGSAMIFAAGLGTRFKPWTDKHPKALAVVNGKSLLQRNIEYLQQYGIRNVIVNVHHFADQIVDAVNKNNGWGSNITISDETDEVLETGGGLLKAKKLFKPEQRFITCNADFLTNLNINKLITFHKEKKSLATLAVADRKTSRYFLLDENDKLCGWRNVKTGEERGPFLTLAKDPETTSMITQKAYSCIAVFEYNIFKLMPFSGKFSILDVYLALAQKHGIYGYNHSGDKLVDVGKPESIAVAESLFI